MDAAMMFKIDRRAAILAACLVIPLATIAETPTPKTPTPKTPTPKTPTPKTPTPKTPTRRVESALDPMTSTVIHQQTNAVRGLQNEPAVICG